MAPIAPFGATVAQVPASVDISVKLETLQDLYNKGLLTVVEFNAKRQELLSGF
jgi:hypothetical protein